MQKERIEAIETLIECFDDRMEENSSLDDKQLNGLASNITDREMLTAGLPRLLEKANDMKTNVENCDKNIKTWQESKRLWTERSKAFLSVLGAVITNLNIPGNAIKAEGVKLATNKRTSIEVDEDWLLGQYSGFAAALQAQLPDYIKVSLDIDKNKLAAFLKTDDTILVDNPDKIHTKISLSTSIR